MTWLVYRYISQSGMCSSLILSFRRGLLTFIIFSKITIKRNLLIERSSIKVFETIPQEIDNDTIHKVDRE